MSEAMRQALEFAAQHLNSSWPEHCQETVRRARAALAPTATPTPTAREMIEECRAALDEELAAWDIDPPLHHVLQARDRCVAWLASTPTATTPPTPAATLPDWVRAYGEERARAALEEAARVCDVTPPYPFRPSIEAAHAIRQLIIRPAD